MFAGQTAIHPRSIRLQRSMEGRRQSRWTLLGVVMMVFLVARPVYQLFQNEYNSSFLDEILVAIVGLFAPAGALIVMKTPSGMKFFLSMLAYFSMILASSLLHDYSFERGKEVFYVGLILDAKVFILFLGAYYLSSRDNSGLKTQRTIEIIAKSLIWVALANSIPVIHDIFGNGIGFDGSVLQTRGQFIRPNGLFHHPVASAQVTLFGFISSLYLTIRKRSNIQVAISASLFILLMAHVSTKEMFVAFLTLIMFIMVYVKNDLFAKAASTMVGIAIISGILASPIGDQVIERTSYYTSSEGGESVRRALYAGGWEIAKDMAPLGSGTSSFASEGSRIGGYSSLYFAYDVFGRWGASYSNDRFLLDTYWPKVMAESGLFGLLFLLITVAIPLNAAWKLLRLRRSPEDLLLVASMLGILVISVASPALSDEFTGPLFYTCAAIALARATALVPARSRRPRARWLWRRQFSG